MWTLNKSEENPSGRRERKVLKAIYGGVNPKDGWRRRTNKELEIRYEEAKIAPLNKFKLLRWLGYIVRM